MKLAISKEELKSVLVLGAGASYGDYAYAANSANKPPLDSTFLERLALSGTRLSDYAPECLQLAKEHFGSVSGIGLEQLFTRIEASEFLNTLGFVGDSESREREVEKRVLSATRPLRLAIQQVLDKCVTAVLIDRETSRIHGWHCEIARILQANDTVISFNYDTLIDHAIRWETPWLWDPVNGRMYGVPVSIDSGYWLKRKPAETTGPFRILKLHGSIHFKRRERSKIKLELSDNFDENDEPLIIAPTQIKRIDGNRSLMQIWQAARSRIEVAEAVIVVGYSAPISDFRAQALLASKGESSPPLKLLLVVNPSKVDRQRVVNIFRGRCDRNTVIMEREQMENLVSEFSS